MFYVFLTVWALAIIGVLFIGGVVFMQAGAEMDKCRQLLKEIREEERLEKEEKNVRARDS